MTFAELADGSYHFSVRAQGEDTADSRFFVKVWNLQFSPMPFPAPLMHLSCLRADC